VLTQYVQHFLFIVHQKERPAQVEQMSSEKRKKYFKRLTLKNKRKSCRRVKLLRSQRTTARKKTKNGEYFL
jgi:hypothetical protein